MSPATATLLCFLLTGVEATCLPEPTHAAQPAPPRTEPASLVVVEPSAPPAPVAVTSDESSDSAPKRTR